MITEIMNWHVRGENEANWLSRQTDSRQADEFEIKQEVDYRRDVRCGMSKKAISSRSRLVNIVSLKFLTIFCTASFVL